MGFWFILLQILKWIGLILLGILALVLLIVILVLFVPIRYRIEGEKYTEAHAKVSATWLLKAVRLTAEYTGGKSLVTKLKVLWFTLMDSSSEVEEDDDISDEEIEELMAEDEDEPSVSTANEGAEAGPETTAEVKPENGEEPEEKPETSEEQDSGAAKPEADGAKPENGETTEAPKEKEHKSFSERLQDINDKVLEFLEKPFEKLESLNKKKDLIINFVENEHNCATVKLLKTTLVKLLKAILPKKGRGKIRFGTGDPASTGQALAGLAVLYVPLGGNLKVTPEFEEKVFEGEGWLKGRIYIITIVVLAAKVWFNRDFKAAKRNLEKLKKRLKKA